MANKGIGVDSVRLSPSTQGGFKDGGNLTGQVGIVLPLLDQIPGDDEIPSIIDTTSNRNYQVEKSGFTYIVNPAELDSLSGGSGANNSLTKIHNVKIRVHENTIPTITGIKIIGYMSYVTHDASNANTGYFSNIPCAPSDHPFNNGDTTPLAPYFTNVFAFKLFIPLEWSFTNQTPPFKPNLLNKTNREVEIYCPLGAGSDDIGALNNLDFPESFKFQRRHSPSAQQFMPISNVDTGLDTFDGTIYYFDNYIVPDTNEQYAEYDLQIGARFHNFNGYLQFFSPNGFIKVKGLITTY